MEVDSGDQGFSCGCILASFAASVIAALVCSIPFWILQQLDVVSINDVRTPLGQIVIGMIILVASAASVFTGLVWSWKATHPS